MTVVNCCFRYMHKTFALAYSYVQPDVVIFLGDLFDEGSVATALEYQRYKARFHSIFYPSQSSKVRFRFYFVIQILFLYLRSNYLIV